MIQLRENTKTVVVICAFAQYDAPGPAAQDRTQLPELSQIRPTVIRLQALFSSERYQSSGIEIIPVQCVNRLELKTRLSEIREAVRLRPGTNLVLFWSGHGGLDGRSFRLATPDTFNPIEQEDGLGLDEISRDAGIARVSTWTLFLDACHAGAGFEDIVTTVNRQLMGEAGTLRGFGAMFSSAPYERARDSVFLNTIIDVLENGPSPAAQAFGQSRGGGGSFNPFNKLLSVFEVFETVPAEYQADPLRFRDAKPPSSVFGGSTGLRIFPNPQYRENHPSRSVEDVYRAIARASDLESHFFPKAIGIDNLETGWHFTGRVEATRAILQWLRSKPSAKPLDCLYVLAADGGTGKSALLGRLIALTDREYRKKANAQGWDEETDRNVGTVPDIDQIDAALNLRNLTAQATADHLADIFKITKADSVEHFVKGAREAYAKVGGGAPCIVLDGLDEAEDPSGIVHRVIHPLAGGGWKLVVATRPSAQTRGAGDLLGTLGEGTRYRLDEDAQSTHDIYHYAYSRLKQSKALTDVAELAARMIAERAENKFLFARMATSSLLRSAAGVTPATLDRFIAQNAAAALEEDVAELNAAFQKKFGRADTGATTMLTALAWAQGEGVPIRDGIWAAMATALARIQGPVADFEETHISWLLREAGRYIQEAGDGEQAVYRLFHKSLVEYFQGVRTSEQETLRVPEERLAQALVACVRVSLDWQYTNPYLVRHMPAHLAARPEQKGLNNLLLNFDWIQARLKLSGIQALLKDYGYCDQAYPATARLHRTLSMVSHILREHPEQLIPQLLGRLSPGVLEIRPLLDGQPGANFSLPPPTQEGLNATEYLILQTPQLNIERTGPSLVDRTLRLDPLLERARMSIRGAMWVPELGGLMQPGALVRIMMHDDSVSSVALSPDGNTIVSGSGDSTVRIWDAHTGAALRILLGHEGSVTSVALSPDGKTVVSGSEDNTVRVWDAQTGEALRTLQGHEYWVDSVAVSPDGKTVVSGSRDKTLRVWDVHTGEALRTLHGHEGWVKSVALSPDGNTIVSGSGDKTVREWDAHTGEALRTLHGHEDLVSSVALSQDGNIIVSGGDDSTVRVWDAHTGVVLRNLHGHEGWVYSVALSPDGNTIVSGSLDKTVRVWDAHTGEALRTLHGHERAVRSVALSSDGNTIVSGGNDNTVREWDAHTGGALRTLHGHEGWVKSVALSPDGKIVVSGSEDNTVRVWDVHTGEALRTLHGHEDLVSSVALSQDGNIIVSGGDDSTVRVWDAHTGVVLRNLHGHEGWVYSVALSPDGNTIVSGSLDRTVRVWDARTGAALRTLHGHEDLVSSVALSPDGKTAVSGSEDKTVRVWDVHTGKALRTLHGHEDRVSSIALSPDGNTVVSGSRDKTVRVWDVHTGEALRTLHGHEGWVTSVALSPDGKTFVSGSEDTTVRVWDTHTGMVLQRLDLDAGVTSVAVGSLGGLAAVVAGSGRTVVRLVRRDGRPAMAA